MFVCVQSLMSTPAAPAGFSVLVTHCTRCMMGNTRWLTRPVFLICPADSSSPSHPLFPSLPLSLCHSSSSCCSAVQWHCRLNLRPVKPVKCQTSESFTFYNLTQSQFQNGTNLFCFVILQICGSRVSEHSQGWLVKLTATFLASWAQYLWKSPSTVLDTWICFVTFRIKFSSLCKQSSLTGQWNTASKLW